MAIKLPFRQLTSQQDSALIQRADVPRSRFTGTWTHKKTFDAGYLVPFLVDEILPGDHMSYDVTAYVRLSTPLFPIFDNQRIDTFFFFVPNRLVWDNWVKMMGEQDQPGASIDYTVPVVQAPAGGFAPDSIYDHMAIPTSSQTVGPDILEVAAFPLRAYNLIYNEWFRDQNLIDSESVPKTDGPDPASAYQLLRRAKSHDYFTSLLPWAQKFDAPTVPIAGTARVTGIGAKSTAAYTPATNVTVFETGGGTPTYPFAYKNLAALDVLSTPGSEGPVAINIDSGGVPEIYADLSEATGISINQLRQAWMIQQLLERDARGGTRYTEQIMSQFNVRNPDFRLQRPEYIGGGQTALNITPIAQTAPTTGATVGALGAAGTASGNHRASYAATEHGYIIGLINVRTELSYQQGLARHWSRRTRLDFYTPALAGLGEQPVYKKEIFALADTVEDNLVLGYQEAWHEYRTRYSEVSGYFRSQHTGTLDMWHLAQVFGTAPNLGKDFIEDNPPMARVLAAGTEAENQQYLADIQIRRTAVRPVSTYGTPAAIGRF